MTRAGEKLYEGWDAALDRPKDPRPPNWRRIIQAVLLIAAIVLFASSMPGFPG